jgi:ribosomal protein L29
MDTEEELNKQLEDIVAKIDKAKRELKALRRHQAESAKGKPRASFITGKEWKIEAEEAAKQLNALKQQEHEIRSKLNSGDH